MKYFTITFVSLVMTAFIGVDKHVCNYYNYYI